MVAEVLTGLNPQPGSRFMDGTIGRGGHAAALLDASAPTGWLHGCDRDAEAVRAARDQLSRFAGRFELRHGCFAEVGDWLEQASCDGVLLDLGVSSPQLDQAGRGFSFQLDGPLDMRMDQSQALTAAQVIQETSDAELAKMFLELGGERQARRLARAIVRARAGQRFETTRQLAGFIEKIAPRQGRKTHPATGVFQALRMVVNDELGNLQRGLAAVWRVLKVGGRLAVITFHSGEDRVVKRFALDLGRDYETPGDVDVPELRRPRPPQLRWLARKAIPPTAAECAANPRARSAHLRLFERIYEP